jgi:hypothetical protein
MVGGEPLCITYPILYDSCLNQKSTMYDVAVNGWVVRFKYHLHGIVRDQWYELATKLNGMTLN